MKTKDKTHFITAIGFDDAGYIYANDPNKKECPRKQKQDKFAKCMKSAFIFWRKKSDKEETTSKTKETASASEDNAGSGTTEVKRTDGKEIVDISKWQGTIDFKALAKKVSFVIARASCGSDKDIRFDEYAKAMIENGIPFGVYCYSYAGTTAKAKEEAQNMVKYAKEYNPLFYVMDAEEARITNETISAFAKELRALGAERIGCYVAHNRHDDYGYDSLRSLYNFTWIPRYGSNDGTIAGSIKPKYICDLWQYTSTGKIAGITGNADMNTITGQGKALNWFLNKE